MCSGVSAVVEEVLAGAVGTGEEVLALVELADRVQAALVERVGRFDAGGEFALDGAASVACWLRARADVGWGQGWQLVHFARTLRTMPATQEAVADGSLSVAKARLLADVINPRTENRFAEHETFLLDEIRPLDLDQTKAVLRHWLRKADTDGPEPADPSRNQASMTQGWDDRWHLEADLDPTSGTVVNAVLDAITERMHHDGRFTDRHLSRRQQAAEALEEMAVRASGPHPDKPSVHPEIVVLVPHEQLTQPDPDPLTAPAELVGTGPISIDDVIRLALLDATARTLTLDENGVPLNLGRAQRLANHDQWIFLLVRDRGCVVPGCARPATWCHAHHRRFWRHGGPTDLANLCLVCTHHHHLIHDKHWTIHQDPNRTWHLTRPDGTHIHPPRYRRGATPGRPRPPGRCSDGLAASSAEGFAPARSSPAPLPSGGGLGASPSLE